MEPKEQKDLDQEIENNQTQIEAIKTRIFNVAKDIIEVLKEDIPTFFEREVKARFLQQVAFSEAITDPELKELKLRLKEAGEQTGAEIAQKLLNWDLWIDFGAELPLDNSLANNKAVWAVLEEVYPPLMKILSDYHFPEDGENQYHLQYQTPTWFIKNKFMKSLLETYWKNIRDFRVFQCKLDELIGHQKKDLLKRRWENT